MLGHYIATGGRANGGSLKLYLSKTMFGDVETGQSLKNKCKHKKKRAYMIT